MCKPWTHAASTVSQYHIFSWIEWRTLTSSAKGMQGYLQSAKPVVSCTFLISKSFSAFKCHLIEVILNKTRPSFQFPAINQSIKYTVLHFQITALKAVHSEIQRHSSLDREVKDGCRVQSGLCLWCLCLCVKRNFMWEKEKIEQCSTVSHLAPLCRNGRSAGFLPSWVILLWLLFSIALISAVSRWSLIVWGWNLSEPCLFQSDLYCFKAAE